MYPALDFELQADTVYQQKERTSRLFFRKNGLSVMRKQLTLGSSIFEETFILDVKVSSNISKMHVSQGLGI